MACWLARQVRRLADRESILSAQCTAEKATVAALKLQLQTVRPTFPTSSQLNTALPCPPLCSDTCFVGGSVQSDAARKQVVQQLQRTRGEMEDMQVEIEELRVAKEGKPDDDCCLSWATRSRRLPICLRVVSRPLSSALCLLLRSLLLVLPPPPPPPPPHPRASVRCTQLRPCAVHVAGHFFVGGG